MGPSPCQDGREKRGSRWWSLWKRDGCGSWPGGERTDITDLVDEDTPYVHTYTDGEGVLHYFLVGGTPEDYGWFEGLKAPDGSGRRAPVC